MKATAKKVYKNWYFKLIKNVKNDWLKSALKKTYQNSSQRFQSLNMALNYQSSISFIQLVYDIIRKPQIFQHFVQAKVNLIISVVWGVRKMVWLPSDITIYVISLQKSVRALQRHRSRAKVVTTIWRKTSWKNNKLIKWSKTWH